LLPLQCFILKRLAHETNNNGNGQAHAKLYSKRTFHKEVNSIAHRTGKHNGLKIMESSLKREQGGKLEKQAGQASSKKHAKKVAAKRSSNSDTLSDESMHNMESRIPWKEQYSKKYASRTIQFNAKGKVVAEESDSDNNRKMPAKMSKKKDAKKSTKKPLSAGPMDTSTDESDKKKKNSANKEEKAFLKSIEKQEKSPFEDTTDNESE
jgi:hypothetical protein